MFSQVIDSGGSLWSAFAMWEHSVMTEEVCEIISEQQLASLQAKCAEPEILSVPTLSEICSGFMCHLLDWQKKVKHSRSWKFKFSLFVQRGKKIGNDTAVIVRHFEAFLILCLTLLEDVHSFTSIRFHSFGQVASSSRKEFKVFGFGRHRVYSPASSAVDHRRVC